MRGGQVLRELMQPVALRMALVEDFVRAIKPGLRYELSALQDGFGPAIVDPLLQAIVVSAETQKGGELCNERRLAKDMSPLSIVTMPLVDEGVAASDALIAEENKASSTDKRRALLGRLRGGEAHWCRRAPRAGPYVIGLTGGIASGKSTARRMVMEIVREEAAAAGGEGGGGEDGGGGSGAGASGAAAEDDVVELDCDKLAHAAYLPGTPAYEQLVATFGEGIVSSEDGTNGAINRKALGALVFAEEANMAKLNAIAWPATAALAKAAISASTAKIIVMEAAVLLEAGWDDFVDEVWTIAAPHAKVIERLAARNVDLAFTGRPRLAPAHDRELEADGGGKARQVEAVVRLCGLGAFWGLGRSVRSLLTKLL